MSSSPNRMPIENVTLIHPIENNRDGITDDTKLYRYLTYKKFRKLCVNGSIYMCNTRRMTDKREREIPSSFFNNWPCSQSNHFKRLSQLTNELVSSYLSCWSTQYDDYALFKLYDRKRAGCMIETTFGNLKRQLNNANIVFYKVEYAEKAINENLILPIVAPAKSSTSTKDICPAIRGVEKFKTYSYEYEHEIRAVAYSKENYDGITIDVDINQLIMGVMLNPFSRSKRRKKVQQLIQSHLPNVKILKSGIKDT